MSKERVSAALSTGELLTPVAPERSFPLWSKRSEEVRDERKRLGLDIRDAARAARIAAPNLVLLLSGRRALATPAGYDLLLERLRGFANFRAREAKVKSG